MDNPQTVICTFRVRSDSVPQFRGLLERHWPELRALELVTDTPEQVFLRDDDEEDSPTFVSIFEWVSEDAVSLAHEHPAVAEVWEAMEPLCETRAGRPSMEFPHYRPLALAR